VTEDKLSFLEQEWKKQEQEICNFWTRTDKAKGDDQ